MRYAVVLVAVLRLTGHAEAQTDFRNDAHGTPRNQQGVEAFEVLLASADTPLSAWDCQAVGGMVLLAQAKSTVCTSGGICAIRADARNGGRQQSRMCVTAD